MKGTPQTAGEWADALEDEAIQEALRDNEATVDDIRENHERLIRELFERRMEANDHTPAIVESFRQDMMEALARVDELAEEREAAVEQTQEETIEEIPIDIDEPVEKEPETILISEIDEDVLDVGAFERLGKRAA